MLRCNFFLMLSKWMLSDTIHNMPWVNNLHKLSSLIELGLLWCLETHDNNSYLPLNLIKTLGVKGLLSPRTLTFIPSTNKKPSSSINQSSIQSSQLTTYMSWLGLLSQTSKNFNRRKEVEKQLTHSIISNNC